jgi:multidrug efflux pump subunit AcrA (membrane-fusion protein)
MENHPQTPKTARKDKGKNILIIVLAILVVLSGIKLYTDSLDRTRKSEEILILSEENNDLNRRIDSVSFQLDLRIQEIEKLGGDVAELTEVRNQLTEERNLNRARSAEEIAALNQRINGFSAMIKEKDSEIVRLREINKQLYTENEDLKSSQAQIQEEVVQLNITKKELQEKVNIAARLKVENIVIAAVNSRGREREDGFKNRQIEKLKISFNFLDNKVAELGPVDIYLQVIAPNNQPIFDVAKGSGTFSLDGREEFFTVHQDILFNNSKQEMTFFYEKGTKYTPGIYEVRVYADGYQIGNKSFEVK